MNKEDITQTLWENHQKINQLHKSNLNQIYENLKDLNRMYYGASKTAKTQERFLQDFQDTMLNYYKEKEALSVKENHSNRLKREYPIQHQGSQSHSMPTYSTPYFKTGREINQPPTQEINTSQTTLNDTFTEVLKAQLQNIHLIEGALVRVQGQLESYEVTTENLFSYYGYKEF